MSTLAVPIQLPDRAGDVRRGMTFGLAVAAGPLLVVGNVLIPDLGRETSRAVARLAADPALSERFLWAQLLYAAASLLFLPLTVVIWRVPARRGAVLRLVGGSLLVVGMISNALSLTVWGYLLRMGTGSGLEPGALARMLEFGEGGLEQALVSYAAIPVAILGLILLGWGLARARVVPTWAPVVVVVGAILAATSGVGVRALPAVPLALGCTAVVVLVERRTRPAGRAALLER